MIRKYRSGQYPLAVVQMHRCNVTPASSTEVPTSDGRRDVGLDICFQRGGNELGLHAWRKRCVEDAGCAAVTPTYAAVAQVYRKGKRGDRYINCEMNRAAMAFGLESFGVPSRQRSHADIPKKERRLDGVGCVHLRSKQTRVHVTVTNIYLNQPKGMRMRCQAGQGVEWLHVYAIVIRRYQHRSHCL